jgi:hypothetical protein
VRRHFISHLRAFSSAGLIALTSLALAAATVLADGNGPPFPH